MVFLQTQFVIALLFGAAVIEVDDAVAAPGFGFGQDMSEQAFGVAVAGKQQFGLFGVVRRDFGVEQPLAVAAGGLGGFSGFQYGNGNAV